MSNVSNFCKNIIAESEDDRGHCGELENQFYGDNSEKDNERKKPKTDILENDIKNKMNNKVENKAKTINDIEEKDDEEKMNSGKNLFNIEKKLGIVENNQKKLKIDKNTTLENDSEYSEKYQQENMLNYRVGSMDIDSEDEKLKDRNVILTYPEEILQNRNNNEHAQQEDFTPNHLINKNTHESSVLTIELDDHYH